MFEEPRTLLPTSTDARKMQTQWEQLGVLMFLGGLPTEFAIAQPLVIGSSVVTHYHIGTIYYITSFQRNFNIRQQKENLKNDQP